jgi:hypothetical protein
LRNIKDLIVVTTVTLAASAHAFADPDPTDSKLSEGCRAAMDLATSSARSLAALENFERTQTVNVEAWEKEYFDRFDAEKAITLTGVVKEFQLSNPHARIMLADRNEQRQADQQWVIEMNAPAGLVRLGWPPKTLTPGMLITVTIHPVRDGSNAGHLLTARLPDGTQMDGGRDRPGLVQDMRQQVVAAEASVAELVKKQCGR